MIYWPDVSRDPAVNFATEFYLADQKVSPDAVFMLWSTAPTVMLGKYQDALAELNLEYIDKQHIQVIRRYSGGGTIYTDPGSFQFSFIQPQAHQDIAFELYLNRITTALKALGFPVQISSRNDLTLNGRKCSGNAQYHHNGYTVHHGSLLFDTDLSQMYDALHVDDLKLRSKHIASIRQRTVNLKTVQPQWTNAKFAQALTAQILQTVPDYQTLQPTAAIQTKIEALAKTRFRDPAFIYGKTPQSQLVKKHYFPGGGLVQMNADVAQGMLKRLQISGDFFSDIDMAALEKQLLGLPFRPGTLKQPIEAALQQTPIRGISADDLIALLFA